VVIEPHVKEIQHNRKRGWDRWQAVVDALPELDWVQINPAGTALLRGVRSLPAPSFLHACRRISGAAAYVGPEGGLYHAAAVFHVPSVAIFGGYVSPANQGYDDCINLYEPEGSPCGQRVPCDHCTEALARITPEQVIHHVAQVMNKTT
jgi:ADP-heptose:LPS heptosyltransferase